MADLQRRQDQEALSGEGGRRKRPRVAEEHRQRASRACDSCRSVKEKCQGGFPCERCTRLKREAACKFSAAQTGRSQSSATSTMIVSASGQSDERVRNMERILSHFLGDVSLDGPNIQRIAEKINDRSFAEEQPVDLTIDKESFTVKALSSNTAHYSGEFSHWNFSQRIRRAIDENSSIDADVSLRLRMDFMKDSIDREYWRATPLHLPASTTQHALACLPPRPIAEFLVQTFLKYGQNNYFFVQEEWLQAKLQQCYDSSVTVSVSDAAWVCSVIMALAIGTQFAHLESNGLSQQASTDHDDPSEDSVGVGFYHEACKLIPDIMIIASVESVQAFLLLAAYALPLDAQGLGYTYLGLSVKMCVQNGMHRKQSDSALSATAMEIRRRLWYSAYALDKRISILHGRPPSVSHGDVDADDPLDLQEFRNARTPNKYHNMCAIFNLTSRLGDIANAINLLRRCPKTLQNEYIGRLLEIREKMHCWWRSLPGELICRDLRPSCPLFRPNVHLKMGLHLNEIYMGRPFLFHPSKTQPLQLNEQASCPTWSVLANSCIDGATNIIELCQLLHEHVGLARASYTEFSSCRAALLALIAQSLNEPYSESLKSALARGLAMIRKMTVGNNSAKAEVAVIEALANATKRLTAVGSHTPAVSENKDSSSYDHFKDWAVSTKTSLRDTEKEPDMLMFHDNSVMGVQTDPFSGMTDFDLNAMLASFPLEQGGFGPLPPFE